MTEDKAQEVRQQFLEEATDYLHTLESGLLGLGDHSLGSQELNALLRAAHSIKGGAAMMGFDILSSLAHRLEDFLKVLKMGKKEACDGDLERSMLSAVDHLHRVIAFNRQASEVEEEWLEENVNPIFNHIHDLLGDPQPEDSVGLLSEEAGEDMVVLLFETEVEGCLQRLDSVLADPDLPCLKEEFMITAQELAGLGQMLELPAFCSLCASIIDHLEATPEQTEVIARLALQEWRRSQAMVMIGQVQALPTQLDLTKLDSPVGERLANSSAADLEETDSGIHGDDSSLIEEFQSLPTQLNLADLDSEMDQQLVGFTAADLEAEITDVSDNNSLSIGESNNHFLSAEDLDVEADDLFASLENISGSETQTEIKNNILSPTSANFSQTSLPVQSIQSDSSTSVTPSETSENTIRVQVQQIEQLSDLFGELTIERNGLNLQLKGLRNLISLLGHRVKVLEKSNFQLHNAYNKVAVEGVTTLHPAPLVTTVASMISPNLGQEDGNQISRLNLTSQFDVLEMDRYDDLYLLSQEVMETIVQIQEVTRDIEINVGDIERTSTDLTSTAKLMQTKMTQVRMRPITDLVGRFPRALREMELNYGKQVELRVKGGSTLIDRTILEALNDPLLHLFRNAFDHGIEEPETRRAISKPEQGVIEISAAYLGNQTIITVRDDGKGINLDKIRSKAITMGLTTEDLENASKNDLLELIFEPGFSTADKVTDLSGRGVGMDVVRTNLGQVGGQIHVDTELGVGTTFTITVPFTLSVVRVLLVESGGILLAFPTNAIEEMIRPEPEIMLLAAGKEVLNWEGYMLPLIRLNQWFQFTQAHPITDTEAVPIINEPMILMVAQGDDLVGIQVDRYWGEQEVTIRAIEGSIKMPPGFNGCTILGDGRVVPLVDAIALLHWIGDFSPMSGSSQVQQTTKTDTGEHNQSLSPPIQVSLPNNSIMIVDDSINVRRFLAATLEKAGYRVEQAKDGQDALEKLRTGALVQAVICDIEMPRLDGYGFLAHVKSEPNGKQLPVIMLTSRSGNKHRQLAMNLGATAYFSKPFREQELLKTLKQLIQK